MRLRSAALIASRILAIYVGFHAVIYAGDLTHDLIRAEPFAQTARSLVPLLGLLALAAVLWLLAPRVAKALAAGTADEPAGSPATAAEIATIAFVVAGLYIASQALPLLAHAAGRLAAGLGSRRDIAVDAGAAVVRLCIGVALAGGARPLSARLFRGRPPG